MSILKKRLKETDLKILSDPVFQISTQLWRGIKTIHAHSLYTLEIKKKCVNKPLVSLLFHIFFRIFFDVAPRLASGLPNISSLLKFTVDWNLCHLFETSTLEHQKNPHVFPSGIQLSCCEPLPSGKQRFGAQTFRCFRRSADVDLSSSRQEGLEYTGPNAECVE